MADTPNQVKVSGGNMIRELLFLHFQIEGDRAGRRKGTRSRTKGSEKGKNSSARHGKHRKTASFEIREKKRKTDYARCRREGKKKYTLSICKPGMTRRSIQKPTARKY